MFQGHPLERVVEIDRQIRAGLYPNADKLAEQFQVSRRLIFRDRTFLLEQLRAPLAFDRERGGWYYGDPAYRLPPFTLTEGGLLAFVLGLEVTRRYQGTPAEAQLRRALERLSRTLGGTVEVDLAALLADFGAAERPVGRPAPPPLEDKSEQPVVIRFDPARPLPELAPGWRPAQPLQPDAAGRLELRFAAADLPAVQRWVLQYGRRAEVLEPLALRQAVQRELLAARAVYSPGAVGAAD